MAPGTFGMRLLLLPAPAAKRAAMSLPPVPPPKSAAILLVGIIKLFAFGQTMGLVTCMGKLGSYCLIGEIEVGDAFGHKLSAGINFAIIFIYVALIGDTFWSPCNPLSLELPLLYC